MCIRRCLYITFKICVGYSRCRKNHSSSNHRRRKMVGGQTKPKIEGVGGGGGASYTSGNIGQVLITIFLFCL